MTRFLSTTAAAAVVLVLFGRAHDNSGERSKTSKASRAVVATPPPAAPIRMTAAQIDAQDHRSPALDRRAAKAYSTRRLLTHLPTTVESVRIEIGGLTANGHTTLLTLHPDRRGDRHAMLVYRQALAAVADSGLAYRTRVVRAGP